MEEDDVSHLESRYLDCCRAMDVVPNATILAGFTKAGIERSSSKFCSLEIYLEQLVQNDFSPLIDAFSTTNLSGIDVVDVRQESPSVFFKGEWVIALLRSIRDKLRNLDIRDWVFWKDMLRDISQKGLPCQTLNLRFSPIYKLNMFGNFLQLHTLNLDFSISLFSFSSSCFSCMPNLMRLSMCETRIANLWMASAALSKLPSLVELRFQNCLCCYDTGACPASSSGTGFSYPCQVTVPRGSFSCLSTDNIALPRQYSFGEEILNYLLSDDESFTNYESQQSTSENSFDSETDFSAYQHGLGSSVGRFSDLIPELDVEIELENSVSHGSHNMWTNNVSSTEISFQPFAEAQSSENIRCVNRSNIQYMNALGPLGESNFVYRGEASSCNGSQEFLSRDEYSSLNGYNQCSKSELARKKQTSHHPSPICFEKHYRQYMIASLPKLNVLDNLPIRNIERDGANLTFKQHFEKSPYNRSCKESVVIILKHREVGASSTLGRSKMDQSSSRKSNHFFSRSLSAAKVGSCPWPSLNSLSKFKVTSREDVKAFRPRQFEYHPYNPSLMVFGTLDGEIVVVNHETGKVVGFVPSSGALRSILGLCWLKKHPSKLVAGSDNGSLKLYDISNLSPVITDRYCAGDAALFSYDEFDHLTSVHVNSTDEVFLASGFSEDVALYDIASGKQLEIFRDLHQDHINVVKFSHHSPSIFATASFDRKIKMWDLRQGPSQPCYTISSSRGNVMVCFSPDDQFLLSSAVDNEVKQHLAVDGRVDMTFNIPPTGSPHNYTRSYYMNGRDYIISGSSEENVVHICCARTGRRFRDISLEVKGARDSMFVQSLRGDPFRSFHMSVLAAYLRPSSKSEIIKVNMMDTADPSEGDSCVQRWRPFDRMGG